MANGENIDLGSFQWDTSKIDNQIAANTLEMQKYSAAITETKKLIKEQSKEIQELEKRIDSEQKTQARLNEQLEKGRISQADYNTQMEKSNEVVEQAIDEQIKLAQAQVENVKKTNEQQKAVKELREENSELNRLMAAGRTELSNTEGAYKSLNNELNALKTEAKNLGAQMVLLEREGKGAGEEYEALKKRWEEASEEANKLNDDFKKLDKAVGDNSRTVGDYKDQIKSAFSELTVGLNQIASGDVMGGFDTIKQGFTGIKTAAADMMSYLLANPITAIFVGIAAAGAGIAAGVKEIFEYNESIQEAIKTTENLTGVTGKAADEIRIRAQSMAESFDQEFDEVLKTANTLSTQLKIPFDQVFDTLQQGFVRGANASGDFLDRLGEYGPLLQKFGFNLDEIVGLQIQAQQAGIFNDKFEDSLKEAGLSLTEFTKAQADALTNAFGRGFGDKVFNAVNSGALSVKDALLLIGSEAKKQGLSVQQTAQLTADVFKGAGEDAGGALVIFNNLYEGLNKLEEPLTKTQQLTLDLADANEELARAKDEALKSDGVIEFQKNLEIFWVKVQTIWYQFVGALMDSVKWFDELTGASDSLTEAWTALMDYASNLWDLVNGIVDVFSDLFRALGLNTSGAKGMASEFFKAINPLNIFKVAIELVSKGIKALSGFIDQNRVNITAFALTVKSLFTQLGNIIKNFDITKPLESLSALKDIDISGTYKNAYREAEKIVAINRKLAEQQKAQGEVAKKEDEVKNPGKGGTNPNDALRAAEAKAAAAARSKAQKDAEKAEKEALARAREFAKEREAIEKLRAENASNIAKMELAEYIAMNAEKYKDDKRLTHAKLQDQLNYFDEVEKRQQELNKSEYDSKVKSVQDKLDEIAELQKAGQTLTENEIAEREVLNQQLEVINKEYQLKDLLIEQDTNEKKKETNKKYLEDVRAQEELHRAIEFQQQLLYLDERNANEYEIKRAQLDNDTQLELEKFLEKNEILREADGEEYDLQQEIALARQEIQAELDAVTDENERLRLQNQLDQLNLIEANSANAKKKITQEETAARGKAYADLFGNISQLLGENTAAGKAAAVAQATINTYTGVSEVWRAQSVLPEPAATIAKVASSAVVVASGLAAVKKIAATPTGGKGGYYDGGYTGPGGKFEVAGDVHRGEVVMSQEDVKQLGGVAVAEALRPTSPSFMNGGVAGSLLSNVQNSAGGSDNSVYLSPEAVGEIAAAIYTGSQKGLGDMADNRAIQINANH